jgi:hypothetical protein
MVRSERFVDSVRVTALFTIAILIGHQMAHILEFRCVHQGKVGADGQPIDTPLGATCGEAGTAWERKVFGGKIHPICQKEGELSTLRGIGSRSVFQMELF